MVCRRLNMMMLCLVLVASTTSTVASAAVVATRDALSLDARTLHLADVNARLARADVREAMIALGVDPADAQARVAALSDAELQQVNAQLGQLPAGGGGLAVVGIVFLVLVLLELIGVTDIFKKM